MDDGHGEPAAWTDGEAMTGHEGMQVTIGDGLEWEDLMPEMNRQTDTTNMVWQLVDAESGAKNEEIAWQFRVGDQVKIRLDNTRQQDHPMHHRSTSMERVASSSSPGTANRSENLVWKDTVLIRADETIDILLDVTNPGRWMAHCHIAEHIESNMMFSFDVLPA